MLEWKYDTETTWTKLVDLEEVIGELDLSGIPSDKTSQTITYMVDKNVYQKDTVKYGEKAEKPLSPTKDGYTFIGWYDENGDKWVFNGYTIQKDLTLYAKFEYNHSVVTFDSVGGIVNTNEAKYKYGDIVKLPVPTKVGYTFGGWYNDEVLVESGSWLYESNVNLVAKWIPNEYTITLNPNGGTLNGETSITLAYGEKFTLPTVTPPSTTPFAGWFLNGEIITNEQGESFDVSLFTKNVTLVADFFIPIYDAEDLQNINNDLSNKYRLMNDIDLANINWTPLKTFKGTFDGNNYTIKNLYCDKTNELNSGFFGYIYNAKIQNLNFDNAYITPNESASSSNIYHTGIVAGECYNSTIDNIRITNSTVVSNANMVGGVVGETSSSSTIKNINIDVEINSKYSTAHTGGVCGYSSDSHFYNINITTKINSKIRAGGIIGYGMRLIIDTAYADVYISVANKQTDSYAGGILSYGSSVEFKNCETVGKISGANYKGSLVGYIYSISTIECSHSNIDLYLVGYNYNTLNIINCYNESSNGFVYDVSASVIISSSYCNGDMISYKYSPAYITAFCTVAVGALEDKSILTEEYWKVTLEFSEQLWDFSNVTEEGYVLPTLKKFKK